MPSITPPQLRKLNVLFSQFAARSLDVDTSRESRLRFFAERVHRPLASSSELTLAEARFIIDDLNAALGLRETSPSIRQPKSYRQRQKLGTEGRRDQQLAETTMLDGTEDVFRLIRQEMHELQMDEERLRRFLRSRLGPNDGRDTIRTLADANRVHWALKQMSLRKQRQSTAGAAA